MQSSLQRPLLSHPSPCPLWPWGLNLVIHASEGSFPSLNTAGGGRTWASQTHPAYSKETSSASRQSFCAVLASGVLVSGFSFVLRICFHEKQEHKQKQNKTKSSCGRILPSKSVSVWGSHQRFVYYFLNVSDSPSFHGREMGCRKTKDWFLFLERTKYDIGLLIVGIVSVVEASKKVLQ